MGVFVPLATWTQLVEYNTFQEGTDREGRWATAWLPQGKSPGPSALPGTPKVPDIKAVATPWPPNGVEA